MNKQELKKLIFDDVTVLENLLKSNPTEDELFIHVKDHLQSIRRLIPKIHNPVFDYLVNKASPEERLTTSSQLSGYWTWLLSIWDAKTIDELYKKHYPRFSFLPFLETAFFTYNATKEEPLKWILHAHAVSTLSHTGKVAWLLIMTDLENKSKADEILFDYGNYRLNKVHWEDYDLDGFRTTENEKNLFNYFPIPNPKKHEYDIKADYTIEVMQANSDLSPEKG